MAFSTHFLPGPNHKMDRTCLSFYGQLCSYCGPCSVLIPKFWWSLFCLEPLSFFRSLLYCTSRKSVLCCSSSSWRCSWRARVLLISCKSSFRNNRFSSLILCVCSSKHCFASLTWKKVKNKKSIKHLIYICNCYPTVMTWNYFTASFDDLGIMKSNFSPFPLQLGTACLRLQKSHAGKESLSVINAHEFEAS